VWEQQPSQGPDVETWLSVFRDLRLDVPGLGAKTCLIVCVNQDMGKMRRVKVESDKRMFVACRSGDTGTDVECRE
jgi:hypothetical protein